MDRQLKKRNIHKYSLFISLGVEPITFLNNFSRYCSWPVWVPGHHSCRFCHRWSDLRLVQYSLPGWVHSRVYGHLLRTSSKWLVHIVLPALSLLEAHMSLFLLIGYGSRWFVQVIICASQYQLHILHPKFYPNNRVWMGLRLLFSLSGLFG